MRSEDFTRIHGDIMLNQQTLDATTEEIETTWNNLYGAPYLAKLDYNSKRNICARYYIIVTYVSWRF